MRCPFKNKRGRQAPASKVGAEVKGEEKAGGRRKTAQGGTHAGGERVFREYAFRGSA